MIASFLHTFAEKPFRLPILAGAVAGAVSIVSIY
jgi:hypothetical protein